ncbi:hypothetical protein BDV32DRAFT_66615 [Aspergillus pseudonomiae]|nr:hypothetical protein BDV32DRAFT_66615 [Aspergillus pseudonomiae]
MTMSYEVMVVFSMGVCVSWVGVLAGSEYAFHGLKTYGETLNVAFALSGALCKSLKKKMSIHSS